MLYNTDYSVGDIRDDEHWIEPLVLSTTKTDVEKAVREFISTHSKFVCPGTLYLFLLQLEYGARIGLEQLKDRACFAIRGHLGGLTSGTFMRHDVLFSCPTEWSFSMAVEGLIARHRKELYELQQQEKQQNLAFQMPGKPQMIITIRDT